MSNKTPPAQPTENSNVILHLQSPYKKLLGFILAIVLVSQPAIAANFTILNGQVVTTQQTLNDNETGTIEAGGQLNTGANVAVTASGINNTVTNSGSMTTSGIAAGGIDSTNTDAIITNTVSGSIMTSGDQAYGIRSQGTMNVSINNNGNILSSGGFALGIFLNSSNSTVNNSGSITTSGLQAHGIRVSASIADIVNSGSILTSGFSAHGIIAAGPFATDATITNGGSIMTLGADAHGIFSNGSNPTITNSGSISTTGANAHGINASGNFTSNASITNSGSIATSGVNAHGIYSNGANATITNSGSISATGTGAWAIKGAANNTDITLNLLPGTSIVGDIDLGDAGTDNDTVNITGNAVSGSITFQNTEAVNLLNGATGVVTTNGADQTFTSTDITVTTIDTTGESIRGVVLSSLTSDLHRVANQRMSYTAPIESVYVASLEASPSMMFTGLKPVTWIQAFGGNFNRNDDGGALAYKHKHTGVSVGYEQDFDQVRLGLMGGYAETNTDTDVASFETNADNFFIGAYSRYKLGSVRISTSLIGGYSEHDNKRLVVDNLAGLQTADSDFSSVFISPSISIASAFTLTNRVALRPSATLSYSIAWLDGYTETGTMRSDLTVRSRKAKAIIARTQLEGAYYFNKISELALRVGINSRHTDDDQTNISLAGNHFNFTNSGDDNVTGGYVGMHFRAVANNQFNIVADAELGGASKEGYLNGFIGMEYLF